MYYFFLAVVVIRYETTAPARRALLLIVGAFFNDTITVAVWTGFHVRLMGILPQPRDYIRRCFADPAIAVRPHDVRFVPIADIAGSVRLARSPGDDCRTQRVKTIAFRHLVTPLRLSTYSGTIHSAGI